MNLSDELRAVGDVEIVIDKKDGSRETRYVKNTVLRTGRRALARMLSNDLNDQFDFYVNRILFGDGGTVNGVKKYVDAGRQGLFGVTRVAKPVIANVDNSVPTQVIFTTVLGFEEVVGVTLNEMALQMANGDLYSMLTFSDLTKTEETQITFNWKVQFV